MIWAEEPFTLTPRVRREGDRAQVLAERPIGQRRPTRRDAARLHVHGQDRDGGGVGDRPAAARNHWGSIAAECLEDAAPLTDMGKREHAFFEERQVASAMPDWAAWPFPAEDPYPAYHAARAGGAVQWNEQLGANLVLSYEHAAAVLRGPEWSSDPRTSPRLLAALGGPGPVAELWSRLLLMSDPPAHTRLRTAVNRFFTPHALRGIEGRVASIVDSALTPLADGEPSRADERTRLPDSARADRRALRCRPRGRGSASLRDARR